MDELKYTGYLFAKPTFSDGVASLVDVSGSLLAFNYSKTSKEADTKALITDWYAVCNDFKEAIDKNVK